MQRAGIFIGVNSTGHLQTLHDARRSAERMHDWAVSQGMKDGSAAHLITDETSDVTPDRILETVQAVIDKAAPEQLIVYFAGHGVVIRSSERWLLSRAPEFAGHAVDLVQTSEDAACGQVGHVVLISDACRTAPEGIQAQAVEGGSIFPNRLPDADERFVDVYYACGRGRPAAELQTQEESVTSYRAVYTEVLLEALQGKFRQALRKGDNDSSWYAGTRELRDLLAVEVPKRIRARKLTARYRQSPQARVNSDPGMWISRLEGLPRVRRYRSGNTRPAGKPQEGLEQAQERVVGLALSGDRPALSTALEELEVALAPGTEDFARTVATVARSSGPPPSPTMCGFKVTGARLVRHFSLHEGSAVVDEERTLQLPTANAPASVVIELDSGLVTILPAIPDFVTTLVLDDNELISVSYEPSPNTWRGDEYASKADYLRALRAVAAACSLHGRFSLDVQEPDQVAASLQLSKGIDPTMGVYAAYAFNDLRNTQRIAEMSAYLRMDIGITFFDLELLGRRLVDRGVTPADQILPCVPLLTQGWSIARSHRTRLPEGLAAVETYARDSLWSVYDRAAFPLFQQCLSRGEIR